MTATRFTSPVGRFVQGDFFKAQDKDQQGAPRVVKTGPNAGQPDPQYFAAVAYRKDDPAWPAFYALLDAQARADFPHLFPVPGGPCVNPLFSMKVVDGDGLDTSGKSNATKDGFAGHWVVRFASRYAPKCFKQPDFAAHQQLQDPASIKRGYFVQINGSVVGNMNAQRPGIFVNLDMVNLVAYGPEIVSGPDAAEAFGAGAAVPAGASPLPVGAMPVGAGPGAALAPPPGAPMVAAPLAPAPVAPVAPPLPAAASPVPASPAPPYAGFMAPPPPAPAPAGPVMLPAANGATYEAMIAAGWTDATLVQHGMMAPRPQ